MKHMWKRPLQALDSGMAWPCGDRPEAQDVAFVADSTLAGQAPAAGSDTGHVGNAAPTKIGALNQVCNGTTSDRRTFEDLYGMMNALLSGNFAHAAAYAPEYVGFRRDDVRHSQADISKTATLLGYVPTHRTEDRPMFSK